MLAFLNNQQNKKQHPNENFTREVMELFTLGRGNYTETDVTEAARSFTGWSFRLNGEFVFRERDHDTGPITILGQTGHFTGDDVLDILLQQPQTARFISDKIARFFCGDQALHPNVHKELARRFFDSGYDIGDLLDAIDFIKTASLATTSLWLPRFLHAFQQPGVLKNNGKILVVLKLSGGNDGLNTFMPVRNDVYYRERPRLAIEREKTLALTSEAGLHPALEAMKKLYDNGHLGVLHNVGYPNPDRSHFRSMDIWHSGSSATDYVQTGWLGRYLNARCSGSDTPQHPAAMALEIDDTLSLALKANR